MGVFIYRWESSPSYNSVDSFADYIWRKNMPEIKRQLNSLPASLQIFPKIETICSILMKSKGDSP